MGSKISPEREQRPSLILFGSFPFKRPCRKNGVDSLLIMLVRLKNKTKIFKRANRPNNASNIAAQSLYWRHSIDITISSIANKILQYI